MTPKEKYKLLTNNEFDTVALSVLIQVINKYRNNDRNI